MATITDLRPCLHPQTLMGNIVSSLCYNLKLILHLLLLHTEYISGRSKGLRVKNQGFTFSNCTLSSLMSDV